MLRLVLIASSIVVCSSYSQAQGFGIGREFGKALSSMGSTTTREVNRVMRNGISLGKSPENTLNIPHSPSVPSRSNGNLDFSTKFKTGPAKTKSYMPKKLGTFDINAHRNAVQQQQNQTAQIWGNALNNIGQTLHQNAVRQQMQQQYYQPQPVQTWGQPVQQYQQPVQQYYQPQPVQTWGQPVQQYQQPVQRTYRWQGN